jgi:hypothetical protein
MGYIESICVSIGAVGGLLFFGWIVSLIIKFAVFVDSKVQEPYLGLFSLFLGLSILIGNVVYIVRWIGEK